MGEFLFGKKIVEGRNEISCVLFTGIGFLKIQYSICYFLCFRDHIYIFFPLIEILICFLQWLIQKMKFTFWRVYKPCPLYHFYLFIYFSFSWNIITLLDLEFVKNNGVGGFCIPMNQRIFSHEVWRWIFTQGLTYLLDMMFKTWMFCFCC